MCAEISFMTPLLEDGRKSTINPLVKIKLWTLFNFSALIFSFQEKFLLYVAHPELLFRQYLHQRAIK